MPHGHCYLWRPEVVWLHVLSDSCIALSYLSIPITLSYFARQRRDLPFRWLFLAFGTFIISCGMTHALEVYTLWNPTYWLSGSVKAVTAASSILTAGLLLRVIPKALALPSPDQLRRAHADLSRVEARFRAAVEGMVDGFTILEAIRDGDGEVVDFHVRDANATTLSRLGTTREALIGAPISKALPPELAAAELERYLRVARTQQATVIDYKMPSLARDVPLRDVRWMQIEVVPLEDGVAVTSRDITLRRRAEQFLLQNMGEGVCLVRASDDEIVFANPRLEAMLERETGSLEGQSATTVALDVATLKSRPRPFEDESVDVEGRRTWLRTNAIELDHPEFGPVLLVTKTDVTQRRMEELDRARLAAIVESTHDAITSKNLEGIIETWNAGATELYGYAASEVVGRTMLVLVPAELEDEERDLVARVARGDRVDVLETVRVHRDGRRLDISLVASPIQKAGGEIVGISTIARDISQRRRDERLLQASLREKSVLLTEVHHRVKNNLQLVLSLVRMHADRVSDDEARAAFADTESRVRSVAIMHELLYQSKDLGEVSLEAYAAALVQAHAQTAGAVRFDISASNVSLPMDKAVPLGMIVNELVTNAVKHAVRTRTDGEAIIGVRIVARESEEEGKRVPEWMLSVTDNGPGFPVDFEPMASTGLGMQIVLALTDQLGGRATFVTTSFGGEVVITFPESEIHDGEPS